MSSQATDLYCVYANLLLLNWRVRIPTVAAQSHRDNPQEPRTRNKLSEQSLTDLNLPTTACRANFGISKSKSNGVIAYKGHTYNRGKHRGALDSRGHDPVSEIVEVFST